MPLPRRMFAAADIHFQSPLRLGRPAQLTSTIVGVKRRVGRTGELLFVEVERVLSQGGETPVRERQTLVYREASGATPPAGAAVPLPPGAEIWTPGPVDLFRFSAVTFNSHRIHYDARYATGEEGYPGLVVHGPFTAVRLCDLARRRSGAALRRFSFRAMAPLFVGDPVALAQGDGDLQVRAVRTDGEVAMQADFEV
jgi:3-methylfumaryl-CoA hydratase